MYTVQAYMVPVPEAEARVCNIPGEGKDLFVITNVTKYLSVIGRGTTVEETKDSYLRLQSTWFETVAEQRGGLSHISKTLKGTPPRDQSELEKFVSEWEHKPVTLIPQGETVLRKKDHPCLPQNVKVEFYLANYN